MRGEVRVGRGVSLSVAATVMTKAICQIRSSRPQERAFLKLACTYAVTCNGSLDLCSQVISARRLWFLSAALRAGAARTPDPQVAHANV